MRAMFASLPFRALAFAAAICAGVFTVFPAAATEYSVTTDHQASPVSVSAPEAASDGYRLGTGDKVRIIVFGEDDLGGEFQIDGNGAISLPLIGQISAAGETASSLEQDIEAKLSRGYLQNPRVSVAISTYRPFYVIGQVNKPGEFPYVNGMSALNAIALAGGYTAEASDGTIYVRRNGSPKEEELPADQMTRIYPGDVIRVAMSPFWTLMSFAGPLAGLANVRYAIP
ncbi:MAG TPA: polysaccharide biosynthesis/export family protein [Rhizomicrobium sp.]